MRSSALYVLACLTLLLLWPQPALAFNPPDYQRLDWKEFPVKPERSAGERTKLFPQWQSSTITALEALAPGDGFSRYERDAFRWLNVVSSRDCIVSLIHYSLDGSSYILRRAQPLPAGQQLSLSILMTKEQIKGETRLLLWRSEPHESWIDLLAQHPNLDSEPIPGVYEEAWIDLMAAAPRPVNSVYSWPWTAGWDTSLGNPFLLYSDPWPLVSCSLSSVNSAFCKDCALYFEGSERLALGAGSLRQWELDWGNEISLKFELAPGSDNLRADLWISGEVELETPLSFPEEPEEALEVRINGVEVRVARREEAYPFEWQLFGADLSPYIRSGLNELTLRVSPLSSTKWLINGIDVWER